MAKKAKCQYKPGKYFFTFPHALTDHPDYFNLSYSAIALLHVMCRLYNGFNNGNISAALSDLKDFGWNSGTLNRAIHELLTKNWIYTTRQGGKGKHFSCSLFAISFIPLDEVNKKLDVKFAVGHVAREFKKS